MLTVDPWKQRSSAERLDHVVLLVRTAAERAARTESVSVGGGLAGSEEKKEKVEAKGKGTVPRHYAHLIEPAKSSMGYCAVKAAVRAALAGGGKDADIDALQVAATGVVPGSKDPAHFVSQMAGLATHTYLSYKRGVVFTECCERIPSLHFAPI